MAHVIYTTCYRNIIYCKDSPNVQPNPVLEKVYIIQEGKKMGDNVLQLEIRLLVVIGL